MQPTSTTEMLCFGTTRGTKDQGPWAARLGHRALSVGAVYSLGCSVVWQMDLYLHTNFNLNRATNLAEWPQLLSA